MIEEVRTMEMNWWNEIPSDRQSDFIAYLHKAAKIESVPVAMLMDQEKLKELIIPTMEPDKGNGWIPEDMDRVRELGQRWGMTNHNLSTAIKRLWDRMNEPLSAVRAAKIIGRSASTLRRWARTDKIHANINAKGHWSFTREILIDHIK